MKIDRNVLKGMLGKTYGQRTVLSVFNFRPGNAQVVTRCVCGYKGRTYVRALLNGRATNCGCHNKRNTLPEGLAQTNRLFKSYKGRALERGYCWQINKELFGKLIKENCFYCGAEPAQLARHNDFLYNGIDRKDNAKGYTTDNVLPCCGVCNRMKSNMTYAAFIEKIVAINKIHVLKDIER